MYYVTHYVMNRETTMLSSSGVYYVHITNFHFTCIAYDALECGERYHGSLQRRSYECITSHTM